jgi:hypothetical protein
MPYPYPSGSRRVPLWMASPLTRPSPSLRRIGIRNFTFETGPGFPHVTARWMTQLPKAALSRGSDPTGCPAEPLVSGQVNRHPFWVDPSSTGDTPRLGTRGVPGSVVPSDAAQPRDCRQRCRLVIGGIYEAKARVMVLNSYCTDANANFAHKKFLPQPVRQPCGVDFSAPGGLVRKMRTTNRNGR